MSEEFGGRIILSAGKAANVASKATTSFNGEPLWATDTGTLYVCQDGKAIEIGSGGAGTVEVDAGGGLSGDGSTGNPLRIDSDAMSDNPVPSAEMFIALVNPEGSDIEKCTIGEMLASVVSGDISFDSDGVATVDFPPSPPPPPAPTITISGAVSGSGTTSIVTTLGANVVNYSNLQAANADVVLGRGNTAGNIVELPCLSIARSLMAASGAPAARDVLGLGDLAQMDTFPGQTFGHTAMTTNSADIGTSWGDVGIATSSLAAGHYDIVLDYRYIINSTTSAYVEFRLIDDMGTVVQDNPGDSIRFAFSTNQSGVSLQGTSSVHWAHTASAGRVLRLQARCTTSGGGTTTPVQVRAGTIGYTILRWRKVY